jgi:transposase
LDALMTRRRQLLDMLTAERNRLEHAVGPMRRGLTDHMRWLERRVADVDRDLEQTSPPALPGARTTTSCRVSLVSGPW